MQADFKIKRITNIKEKDLTQALDIYLHTVDEDAVTSTTQIRDYIKKQYPDKRKLYFYILYSNGNVVGFAEYAYLQDTETLFIDYLCTCPRNHTYFYMFYHMLYDDISSDLRKKNNYVRYIVTELSLKKNTNKEYIDVDSNYFRQLLSVEQFKILKTPYYQPYYNANNKLSLVEYNLAISPQSNGFYSNTTVDKVFYSSLVNDIYINHYSAWYEKYTDATSTKSKFAALSQRVASEFTKVEIDDISAVNCSLFLQGLCKQVSIENITLKKRVTSALTRTVSLIICVLLSVITFCLCYKEYNDSFIALICAFLTIVASCVSLFQFIQERFR